MCSASVTSLKSGRAAIIVPKPYSEAVFIVASSAPPAAAWLLVAKRRATVGVRLTEQLSRALVLDNEPAALAALGSLLASWGWQVHAVRHVEQALAAPWRPDLLILDLHLDGGQVGLDV